VKSDVPYLRHVADSILAIESYVAGGRDVFMKERLVQDAVIRNFEIIGKAARQLSRRCVIARALFWARSSRSATG
jgi:uncharacterized protein with HEPN domain